MHFAGRPRVVTGRGWPPALLFNEPPFAMRSLFFLLVFCGAGAGEASASPDLIGDATYEQSQPCGISLSGRLVSEHDGEPMAFANVFATRPETAVLADDAGNFVLTGLCPGEQTVTVTHVGCDNEVLRLELTRDTQLTVYLHHHDNYTETVVVTGDKNVGYSAELDALATEELTDALERMTGVSSLRSGTGVSKPVVDGLFGNRLSLQNNGLAQSGQQWGNDHAPEIDPWVAAYLRVVEGVEALKYAGPTLAATVLVEPAPLREDERAAGKAFYGFQANGRGHQLAVRTSKGGRLAYRLSASGKYAGTQRTPDYFLNNTGRREANAALQLAWFLHPEWTTRAYLSTFNANIGVLRGAHIGNLTDLETAIGRDVPFFTPDTFSYRIASPRQGVGHHLAKLETEFRPNEDHRFTLRYGGQLNDRREFDVRRGDRSDRAALALRQWNHLFTGAWHYALGPQRHLDANVQFDLTWNDNQPGTGVLPLIPDYNANRQSSYLAYHYEAETLQYHFGLRYDRQFYEAITISRDLPRRIERFEHTFSTLGASAEVRRRVGERTSLRGGITLRERAPQINELYAGGLHQGVSGIEEGDASLTPERSLKASVGLVHGGRRLTLSGNLFVQPVTDYIFLQPQAEFRITPRGAFPVFLYRSGDALLHGLNLQSTYQLDAKWGADARLALVRGQNRTEGRPLLYVPSDNLRLGLRYDPLPDLRLRAEGLFVRQQTRLEPEQDFLAPPPAYALVNASVGYTLSRPNNRSWHLRAAARNLLNTRYRDYLDRQRYFADAPGRSLDLTLTYEW